MNSSSSKSGHHQGGHGGDHFNQKPEWLDTFLQRTFFEACSIHQVRRNELNKYCVNCDLSACQYCSVGTHKNHKLLKIYRHVYKDVVSLSAMDKYMDCTKIQPYKSNKRLVIALNPLPHCGAPLNNEKKTCRVCMRRLNEPKSYRYCSIACKVEAFAKKKSSENPHNVSVCLPLPVPVIEACSIAITPERPKYKPRKRKGIPCRSPLF